MSSKVLSITEKSINAAHQHHQSEILEKETFFVIMNLMLNLPNQFSKLLKSIRPSADLHVNDDPKLLTSLEHCIELKYWLVIGAGENNKDFGRLKTDFEKWFYKVTDKGTLEFEYPEDYLLTPAEACVELGISRPTLNKYMEQGLEQVETRSHKKIPKHIVELWKDPVYATKMQLNYQEKKMRSQTYEERLKEITLEIAQYEVKYGNTYNEYITSLKQPIDEYDDAMNYFDWKDLEDEKKEILKEIRLLEVTRDK